MGDKQGGFRDRLAVTGIDWCLAVPWFNRRRPFVALNVVAGGYDVYQGRSRRVWDVGVMAGRQFTDNGWFWSRWFTIRGRWSPAGGVSGG